ncbi:MerC domain-containing protein [Psychrobium sp. 1_MG-2023]|uniref:MerC domain-containing protein n=1 Tax=Psychrobium sp. 1_MG-2023 TaxID=3062624 RepID=UPI000C321E7D|nr:MerC domain-containing protein [Psychrobium sp. 1_MG-2023]MDP2561181.1 MerC domain-containing protein [Psychrobium sp. 1_MG-2023]PKF55152.1 hypothetical protein CW748_14425 [Alteromonadales bacterium alter-6D02]
MKIVTTSLDKSAIALSILCLIHCLALPVFLVLFPVIAITAINQELFHALLLLCVLPISIAALIMGCKQHNQLSVAFYGGLGLVALVVAVTYGESQLGAMGEKVLTTIGTVIIAFAHLQNYKLSKTSKSHSH